MRGSARQQRHLSAISEFGCTINYVPGRKKPVADALLRVEINSLHLGIDYKDLAREQAADPETADYRMAVMALQWEDVPLASSNTTLLCDTSTGRPCPLVPASRRKQVFDIVHSLSHPSGCTMACLMTNKFVWHGINKDVHQWARSCIPCQASKMSWHAQSGVGDFPQPRRRFGHIHINVIGPIPQSGGARYLLIIDHSTCWPEATPMEEASTASCAKALHSSWISRFGVPDSITKDRGPAFLSELWASLARLMGTTLHSTTAYNPAVNGMIKRVHRSLKAALMARCTDERWKEQLPWVLLGLCTALKANGNASPAEKVYGETLTIPREFFPPSADGTEIPFPRLRELAQKFASCHKTFTGSPPALHSCTYVFIRVDAHWPPLTRPYRWPHRVIKLAAKAYLLDIHGWEDWITIDRLKPAFLLNSEVREKEGRRPRVPPQYLPADTPAPPPKQGPGLPRKHIKPTPDIGSTPRPQFSGSRGPLRLPQRLRD
ncbi:uncharacterized protein [Macrobrachium rosenbergii]|uniref:uncharacterized protein n=1 Tax=Macrobrachium rosenbergii TaxID=79674 RepID=UPI0034D675EB